MCLSHCILSWFVASVRLNLLNDLPGSDIVFPFLSSGKDTLFCTGNDFPLESTNLKLILICVSFPLYFVAFLSRLFKDLNHLQNLFTIYRHQQMSHGGSNCSLAYLGSGSLYLCLSLKNKKNKPPWYSVSPSRDTLYRLTIHRLLSTTSD